MQATISAPEQNFKMRGDWSLQTKILKYLYPSLNDNDLAYESGHKEELLHKLEVKLNLTRDQIITLLRKDQPEEM